jgi:hypothetical protein
MKKYGYTIAYKGENKLKTKLKFNQQKKDRFIIYDI